MSNSLFRRAASLFARFHGRAPSHPHDLAAVDMTAPTVVLYVGELTRVAYIASGEKEEYIHKFNSRSRPLLYTSSDGKQLYILKGGYRFTDRGIVG